MNETICKKNVCKNQTQKCMNQRRIIKYSELLCEVVWQMFTEALSPLDDNATTTTTTVAATRKKKKNE